MATIQEKNLKKLNQSLKAKNDKTNERTANSFTKTCLDSSGSRANLASNLKRRQPLRKLTLILILFLNCKFAVGQTYSSVTSDKEIYDFLNWMTVNDGKYEEEPKLKRKHIYHKILSWETENFITKDTALINQDQFFSIDGSYIYQRNGGTDTIFNQQDRDFIFKQFKAIKDTVWHHKFSKSKLLTTKKQKRPNRYYYSIPLFSVDRKYVIIYRKYFCGDECAYGGYYVYRRVGNNKWEYLTAVNTWMS